MYMAESKQKIVLCVMLVCENEMYEKEQKIENNINNNNEKKKIQLVELEMCKRERDRKKERDSFGFWCCCCFYTDEIRKKKVFLLDINSQNECKTKQKKQNKTDMCSQTT